MSRCLSCFTPLSSRELTRKYTYWKDCIRAEDQYIGLCTTCCKASGITNWVDNTELPTNDAPADLNSYMLDSEPSEDFDEE